MIEARIVSVVAASPAPLTTREIHASLRGVALIRVMAIAAQLVRSGLLTREKRSPYRLMIGSRSR